MLRPPDLPDFTDPPLYEVVLGVQFKEIPEYSAVDALPVWDLFRSEFPIVHEQPQLLPQFETFGGIWPQPGVQLQISSALPFSRLLFATENSDRILQFQSNRFLTNWRKTDNLKTYPRFETIVSNFKDSLLKLHTYCVSAKKYELDINQVEISYINIIQFNEFAEQSAWLRQWEFCNFPLESIMSNSTEIEYDANGKPFARMYHELSTVNNFFDNKKAFRLGLTYRGNPDINGIEGSIDFLHKGHEAIVKRFSTLTTESAHKIWGRIQ